MIRNLMRKVFIQSQATPNPNSMRFIPVGKKVIEGESVEYSNVLNECRDPLVSKLF